MKNTTRALAILLIPIALVSISGRGQQDSSLEKADPVQETMTKMRLFSTLLEEHRREDGTYPMADEKLHSLREVLAQDLTGRDRLDAFDAWNHPIWYRANHDFQELISYGSDGTPDQDYEASRLTSGRFARILDARDPSSDLVAFDGRFTRRPFGSRTREFVTINAINAIYTAAASYAVDNNRYPGTSAGLSNVTELLSELVPVYLSDPPLVDGWGRPLLYSNNGSAFLLVSFGEDGSPDHTYYSDLPCGLELFEEGTGPAEGGDAVQVCGRFADWPRGTEP
jgi:type II secretion system (T2SS) protein G